MEEKKDTLGMLDLVIRPGFCVKENQIIKVNQAAESLFITPGTDVRPLLLTGSEEYAAFTGGCLYLTLSLSSHSCGASVTRVDDIDVFLLEQESDNGELRSMALAARELREPLTNVMITADSLFPLCAAESSPRTAEQVARLNRGLFQILRIIGNMSDAERCAAVSHQETVDIPALFAEFFEKAETLVSHTGITLTYEGPAQPTYSGDSGDYGTPYYWYDEDGDVWYWNGYENEFISYGSDGYIDDDTGEYMESNDAGWDYSDEYYDDYDPWSDPGDGWGDYTEDDGWGDYF